MFPRATNRTSVLAGRSGGSLEIPFYPPLVAWGAFQLQVISPLRPRSTTNAAQGRLPRQFHKTVGAILYENFGMGYFEVIGTLDLPEWTYAPVGGGCEITRVGWTDSV